MGRLTPADFDRCTHISFDCYGTLIDWETGILNALRPLLTDLGASVSDVEVLRLYTELEARAEAGEYRPYRAILAEVTEQIARRCGLVLPAELRETLPDSIGAWPPFPDTVEALGRLHSRRKLAILSNIDDSLFALSNALLGVRFDEIVTAEQVHSYKPRKAHFETTLARLGVPASRILHVAQSLYHDHVPAQEMGFTTVRINRPSRLPNTGLAPQTTVRPDLDLPDLKSLADLVCS